jgi:hypothetical protein
MKNHPRYWSDKETQQLIALYPHHSGAELSIMLGRKEKAISDKAKSLRLTKTPEYKAKLKEIHIARVKELGKQYQYKKGRTPHNKGVPMSPETFEKIKHTLWQKGSTAFNTKPIGYERLQQDKSGHHYLYIKYEEGKRLMLKNRYVWQQHHGPIPKDHIIVFRDGNQLNCDISNLECISKSENILRNSINHQPKELKECIMLLSKINKTIKNGEE